MNPGSPLSAAAHLATAAGAVLAGSLLVQQLPGPLGAVESGVVGLVSVLLALRLSSSLPLWFAFSMLNLSSAIEQRIESRLPAAMSGSDYSVSGWVDSFPAHTTGQVSFSLRVTHSGNSSLRNIERLRLSWYDPPQDIDAGTALDLTVRLRVPRGLSNPGGFDYEKWLFLEGYGAVGYVRDGNLARDVGDNLVRGWFGLRAAISRRLIANAPGDDAGAMLTALAIGERHLFDDKHWQAFRRTGTSHLVAISGLHIGLIASFSFWLMRKLWLLLPGSIRHYDLYGAAASSLVCASLYALLAGFGVPAQRALLMLAVALAAVLSRRRISMISGLSTAAIFVLLWDPFASSSASFWLSFMAVALLWQLAEMRMAGWDFSASGIIASAALQWRLCLGLVPVTAFFFGEISLIAPIVNFFAIPYVSLALVPATLISSMALVFDGVGEPMVRSAGELANAMWLILEWLAAWNWSAIVLPTNDRVLFFLAIVGVILMVPVHPLPGRYLALLATIPLFTTRVGGPGFGIAKTTVLDVGHGLAVIVETREHVLLFDSGPRYPSGFDSGADIVVPALHALGYDAVDTIVISHSDNDHAGGAPAVIAHYPEAALITGPDVSLPDSMICSAGASWVWDGVDFEFLHPPSGFRSLGNDSSCVLRVSTADDAILLTGDVEQAGERSMLDRSIELDSGIVIVPHHGSATSSSEAFVDAIGAAYAIVSAGRDNRWGFPRPEVQRRWEIASARVVTTGHGGAVTIIIGGAAETTVVTRRESRRRYWFPAPDGPSG